MQTRLVVCAQMKDAGQGYVASFAWRFCEDSSLPIGVMDCLSL